MTNYNQLGQKYVSYASASALIAYGTLQREAGAILSALHQEVIKRQRENREPLFARDLLKLLSRLDTVFYYSGKVAHFLQEIEALPKVANGLPPNMRVEDFCPPLQMIRNHKELGMEFESLIFHSVATLDTLANLFADHCRDCIVNDRNGRPVQVYFSNINAALRNSLNSDRRARYLLDVLDECAPTLGDIVLSIGRKTLRNQLAHETPIADLTESNFVIYWLEDGSVLRFDHEVYGMPLVASARKLIQTVSYLIIKSVAILLAGSDSSIIQANLDGALAISRDTFEPSWTNPVISWRAYVSDNEADPEFTVARTEPDGFSMQNVRLKPEIYKHAKAFTVNSPE